MPPASRPVPQEAATIGAKYGFAYGEEFNYVGGRGPSLPEHLRERAVAK